MKEEIKLAIEGYNAEKLAIHAHLLSLPVGIRDYSLTARLEEIDATIVMLLNGLS